MRYSIGIDIGGTNIEGVLVNEKGKILKSVKKPTQADKPKNITLNNLFLVIEELLDEAEKRGKKVLGIGVGVPGPVPPDNRLKQLPNVPNLQGINLQSYLKKKFKKKVICENDANCFALSEAMYGAGKNKKVVIGVIWGTGIGCGIIINKKVYKGVNGLAGELGHTVIDNTAKVRCGCGYYGDIESFTSAPNLIKYYKLFNGKKKNVDSKYIMDCKDKISKKVAEQAIHYLSISLAFIVNLFNPDIIILGGGISNSSHYKEINSLTNRFVTHSLRGTFKVVKHKIGHSAGVIGAAALVFC